VKPLRRLWFIRSRFPRRLPFQYGRTATIKPRPRASFLERLGRTVLLQLGGTEVDTSADRQLIRGHNLVGAVRLQFVRPAYFENHSGEHAKVLSVQSDLDIPQRRKQNTGQQNVAGPNVAWQNVMWQNVVWQNVELAA
jgi:hypothetical protein